MKTYLIIDKFTLSRETLSSLICQTNDSNLIHQANSIEEAKHIIELNGDVDFLIYNPTYLERDSNVYMNQLVELSPQAKILVISHRRNYMHIQNLINNGAHATVTITSTKTEICAAIRALESDRPESNQEHVNYNEVQPDMDMEHSRLSTDKNKGCSNFKLTKRQIEVLDYVTKGYANKLIAYELGVSEGTVKLHVSSILRALKVTNRTEAAMRAGQFLQSHAL